MSKILLVEDSKVQALMAKGVLEAAGHSVQHVATAEEAVKACYHSPPDIVLQDQHLVETSGLEVCRRIKNDLTLASIPVLVLTAGDKEKDHVAALDAGADAFLPKGSPNDQLLAVIARQVSMSGSADASFANDSASRPNQPARILVIDDSPTFLELLVRKLTEVGFDVTGASSGAKGLSTLAEQPFDIAMVDVVMPEMDGFEFCEQARQWARDNHRELGLLVMTGSDRQDVLITSLEAGADDYVTKQHEIDVLVAHATALTRRIARAKQMRSLRDPRDPPDLLAAHNNSGNVDLPQLAIELRQASRKMMETVQHLSSTTLTAEQQQHLQTLHNLASELSARVDDLS